MNLSRFLQLIACMAATFLFNQRASAGEAACSADGKYLYRLNYAEGKGDVIEKIDPESLEITFVDLPKSIPTAELAGLAISNAGHLLIAVPSAVWAFDVEKNKAVRVCGTPEGATINGIAYDSKTSAILITVTAQGDEVRSDLWILPKGAKAPLAVVNRRAGFISGLTFLTDGRIVFAARGDLWIGQVSLDDEENSIWSLQAIRFGPVAEWETANSTSGSYGARNLAVAGDGVLVHIGRLGGSGSGQIIKAPVPEKDTEQATYQLMSHTLASLEELGETGTRGWLCSNLDGSIGYYVLDGGKLMRWQNGKAEEMGVLGEKEQ